MYTCECVRVLKVTVVHTYHENIIERTAAIRSNYMICEERRDEEKERRGEKRRRREDTGLKRKSDTA